MKIECLKEKLFEALSRAEKIINKNPTLPILSCVYLEAEKNNLTIKATNLDLGLEIKIPIKVIEEGKCAVSTSLLTSYIGTLIKDKNIVLETKENNLHITGGNSNTIIKTLNYEDFPIIPKITKNNPFLVKTDIFIKGLKAVWYSASSSTIKPELSSVFIYQNEDQLFFVATDSFRLAEKKIKIKKGEEFENILIPSKNVSEIVKILEGVNEEVEISTNNNQISFSYNQTYLVSRIIDGVFPDYKQIIPKEKTTEVVVFKQDVISSLKTINIFSDSFNQLNLNIDINKKLFEMKTTNNNIGEVVNKLEAVCSGENLSINFNHKYITDCFQSIESDSIDLSFSGINKPVIIKGVSDNSFMYLVMPMNK